MPHAPTNPGPPAHYIAGPFDALADRVRANYSGMVVSMDQALGNLTDALKSTGMWQDTLLVLFGECVNRTRKACSSATALQPAVPDTPACFSPAATVERCLTAGGTGRCVDASGPLGKEA